MPETKILLSVFHPDLEKSRGNAKLFEAAKGIPNLSYRDMYLEYDGKYIDGATEEIFLTEYDCFIFQYPMYWFGAPTLLSEWLERALARGFAWPPGEGDALRGKKWMTVVTTAAPADEYTDAPGSASMKTLLKPLELTAGYCQMEWLEPFVVHDVRAIDEGGLTDEALEQVAIRFRSVLEGL
ncbi:NAD(P)H-dependent oxidoreductase [Myxococcota bacterium]|nr:NAD(P)H-dependent oxidoreductase [Myxococcota bacterium]MBU1534634.1 NAD(P)H-dependent oxidoreductase [Myxococcota bacterium]